MHVVNLGSNSVDNVFHLITENKSSGIASPTFYTISTIIQLYSSLSFALTIDDKLVGVSLNCPMIDKNGIFVYMFIVHERFRRRRIGSYLFLEMCQELKKMRFSTICLRVLQSNHTALKFWGKMGFLNSCDIYNQSADKYSELFLEKNL